MTGRAWLAGLVIYVLYLIIRPAQKLADTDAPAAAP